MRALEADRIKVVPTGLKHGTVTAIADSVVFELTTLRRDVETDGRRAVVAFTDDWQEDASRRDFTFNALYADPDGTLYDPFEGRADLAAGRVRFIGDPDTRIAEDRLRVLRFFRFQAWYGQPPIDGAELPGLRAAMPARWAACRASGCARSCCARSRRRAPPMRSTPCARRACSTAGCPSMTARPVCARWPGARTSPTACAGWRRSCRRAPMPVAIGKRLKLSTQESLRLEVMLAREPVMDIAGGPRAWRAGIYRLGNGLYADRLLLAIDAPGDWRAALAMARSWTPPELPVSGGDALKLGLKPGPKVGALIDAVERWWIDGDFTADRAACLAELERLALGDVTGA